MKKIINHLSKGLKKKLRSKFLVCFLLVFTCYWVLVALAHAQTEGARCSFAPVSNYFCNGTCRRDGENLRCVSDGTTCQTLSNPSYPPCDTSSPFPSPLPSSSPAPNYTPPPPQSSPPPTGNNNSADVIAPSLDDDFRVVDASNKALLPPELYLTPSPTPGGPPTPTSTPIQVGVEQNFLLAWFQQLGCLIPWGGTLFCKMNVNFNLNQTEVFANQSANLTNAEKPTELQITPAEKDDRLEDVTDDTGNPSTGNEKINQVNKSLGADQGFYAVDIPQFEELKVDKYNNDDPKSPFNDPASPFYQSEQDKKENNLQLNNTPFDQDLRVPETNIKQILFNKAHYPEGMKPF